MDIDNGDNCDPPKVADELLIEIFVRSSVESLQWAKCVCKRWYSLINDPSFAYTHLQYKNGQNHDCLLVRYSPSETQNFKCALLYDKPQLSTTYDDLDYRPAPEEMLHMEGPVNGLYCLFDTTDHVVMWNPALMDFKILPLPPPNFLRNLEAYIGVLGFGLDPLTNDYKVVVVQYCTDTKLMMPDGRPFAYVYSLSTDTWRFFDIRHLGLMDKITENYSCPFLDATYHWWDPSGLILAFDMSKEVFRVIQGPELPQLDYPGGNIALYEEHVALLFWDKLFVHMWVMVAEGIWDKQYCVGPLQGLAWPLGFWKSKLMFLQFNDPDPEKFNSNSQIGLCDVSTQEMGATGPQGGFYGYRTCIYHESLVSLTKETERKRKHDLLNMVSEFFGGTPSF